MKQITTPAIILRRINYGEADRILTVLTPEYGHVSLLAKGVRKSKSKLAGGLELFSTSDISFVDGRSKLKTIISTQLSQNFGNIVKDIHATMIAYDILKYSGSYSEHSTETIYFYLCRNALIGLDEKKVSAETVFVWFCLQLLGEAGNSLNLEKPLDSAAFNDEANYSFSFDDMSFFTDQRGIFTPNHIKLFRLILRSESPKQLATIKTVDNMSKKVFNIFQQIMSTNRA